MGYTRRRFVSNKVYELCIRAKSGLPFVSMPLITFILECILARVQRDSKVVVCHHIWNGSHCHIIFIAKDARQCKLFYSELMKKITDTTKRLLGITRLNLLEKRPMVALIPDEITLKDRIAYLYANPAQDGLVDSIVNFPGFSSYNEFLKSNAIGSSFTLTRPWLRLPTIAAIGRAPLAKGRQRRIIDELIEENDSHMEEFIIYPNAWMECFGIEDVGKSNKEIQMLIEAREKRAKDKRGDKKVLGRRKLLMQGFMRSHRPKKKERRIHLICKDKELRMRLLEAHRAFCDACVRAYHDFMEGNIHVLWPPGAFKPPLPSMMNVFV